MTDIVATIVIDTSQALGIGYRSMRTVNAIAWAIVALGMGALVYVMLAYHAMYGVWPIGPRGL